MILFSENIALNKRATQIGTSGGQGPEFANDGNLTQSPWYQVCSRPSSDGDDVSPTEKGVQYTWWTVDLASQDPSQRFGIKSVTIYNGLVYGTYSILYHLSESVVGKLNRVKGFSHGRSKQYL